MSTLGLAVIMTVLESFVAGKLMRRTEFSLPFGEIPEVQNHISKLYKEILRRTPPLLNFVVFAYAFIPMGFYLGYVISFTSSKT